MPHCRLFLFIFFIGFSLSVEAQRDTIPSDSSWVFSRRTSYPLREQTVLKDGFNTGNIFDPLELLTGRVNGLLISKPGHNVNGRAVARLRGVSSLYASEGPLMVVDGFVGLDPRFLDPNDLAEISFSPSGQGSAAYGLRGGSGAIRFRTRSLFEGHKPGLHYQGEVAVSSLTNVPENLNAAGHLAALRSVAELNGLDPEVLIGRVNYGGETDWLEEVTRSGLSHNHYLSYAGDLWKDAAYRVSSGFRNVQGVGAANDGFQQLTGRLQFEQKLLKDQLDFRANIGYFDYTGDVLPADVLRFGLSYNPSAPIRVTQPNFTVPESQRQRSLANYGEFFEEEAFGYHNPVAIQELFRQQQQENALLTQVASSYRPTKGVMVRGAYHRSDTEYSFARLAQRTSRYQGRAGQPEDLRGTVSLDQRALINQQFNLEGFIDLLDSDIGTLNLNLGYFHQRFDREERFRSGNGFPQENVTLDDVSGLLEVVEDRGMFQKDSLSALEKITAFYAGFHYDHPRLFQVFGSLRYEGSSRNGPDARYGLYGALNASVDLSEWLLIGPEKSLFFRAGYDVAGQQPFGVADYRSRRQQVFQFAQAPRPVLFTPVEQFVNAANPDLAPERVSTFNVGLDFIPLSHVPFKGQIDFYRRTTANLLVPTPPRYRSSTFALPPQVANMADLELRSSGVEVSASYLLGFEATQRYNRITVQLATYSAKVVSVDAQSGYSWGTVEERLFRGGTFGVGGCCSSLSYLIPGQELGVFQAPVLDVEASRSSGQTELLDDGRRAIIGGGLPSMSINLINEFRRDRFSFSFVFSGVFGHEIINFRNALLANEANLISRPIDNLLINDETLFGTRIPNTSFTDYNIESGSFISLSNVQLRYQFLTKKAGRKTTAELYLAGQNLLLFTGYSGNDPSVRFFNDFNQDGRVDVTERDPAPGVDAPNSFLRAATLSMGVRLGL